MANLEYLYIYGNKGAESKNQADMVDFADFIQRKPINSTKLMAEKILTLEEVKYDIN
jgi:hypothetical protein